MKKNTEEQPEINKQHERQTKCPRNIGKKYLKNKIITSEFRKKET